MSNERVGYKVELEELERDARGEIRVLAHALEVMKHESGEHRPTKLTEPGYRLVWHAEGGIVPLDKEGHVAQFRIEAHAASDARLWAELFLKGDDNPSATSEHMTLRQLRRTEEGHAAPPRPEPRAANPVRVQLTRTQQAPTRDLILWTAIRYSTESVKYSNYARFLDYVLCGDDDAIADNELLDTDERGVFSTGSDVKESYAEMRKFMRDRAVGFRGRKLLTGTDGYLALREATDWFLKVNVGVLPNQRDFSRIEADLAARVGSGLESTGDGAHTLEAAWNVYTVKVNGARLLPYLKIIRDKLTDSPIGGAPDSAVIECSGLLQEKLQYPCFLELIWSYWQEEGMLVQTMNAIARRFQNRRAGTERDPLANLEIDPLRPLNNMLWGYVQDELGRLSVVRRAHEYEHQYGLRLEGRAMGRFRPADRRHKFVEAFHNFLQQCHTFHERDDQTTVLADGFPVLNALKEVHYLLAQGAGNQFGDLPSTARAEMLVQQWLLGRPEMREFLGGRVMVPYPEPWMERVDAMKALQGWTDTSVVHFRDLATFGEQIVLGIRYGAWSLVNDPAAAANFARHFRPEIQGYMHVYRAVTSVEIGAPVTTQQAALERNLPPSVHLMRRLAAGKRA